MMLMGGAFRLKWVGQLWQCELLFFGSYAQKNTGLQGNNKYVTCVQYTHAMHVIHWNKRE